MLRYKTETRPGLVALYDIRPGNGAGPFLQPRSPQGAQFPGYAYPKISQQYTPTTHTEAVHCQGSSWGLTSLSLTTEGSWIHCGWRIAKSVWVIT